MKKILMIAMTLLLVAALTACGCSHDPTAPTEPPTEPTTPTEPTCQHTYEDDGDCTTEVTCSDCGETVIPANQNHIASDDDYDCTTVVTCSECDYVFTEAMEHNFSEDWCSTPDYHGYACVNDGCDVWDAVEAHYGEEDDGDCTTWIPCKCGWSVQDGNESHTYGTVTYTWADDHSSCTATASCTVDGCEHTETETKTATQDGAIFTVDFDNEVFETQTIDLSANIGDVIVDPWKDIYIGDIEAEEE